MQTVSNKVNLTNVNLGVVNITSGLSGVLQSTYGLSVPELRNLVSFVLSLHQTWLDMNNRHSCGMIEIKTTTQDDCKSLNRADQLECPNSARILNFYTITHENNENNIMIVTEGESPRLTTVLLASEY